MSSVVPFSQSSDTGDYILKQEMSLDLVSVPVHKLQLDSGLVQGEVEIGVCPELPIQGMDVLLVNDLAGNPMWAHDLLPPVITSSPSVQESPNGGLRCFPGVFTACDVTQAMFRGQAEGSFDQDITGESLAFSVPIPDPLL